MTEPTYWTVRLDAFAFDTEEADRMVREAAQDAVLAGMYDLGCITWHTSDEDGGGPDVGISVGLGGGRMLYAGDVPDKASTWFLAVYDQNGRSDIGSVEDCEAAREMIETIAASIRNGETP